MMDKPFRTIEEQIAILNSRGVATDKSTPEVLAREGYYSVVNGYKDLYLDPAATKAAGEDVFRKGTTFQSPRQLSNPFAPITLRKRTKTSPSLTLTPRTTMNASAPMSIGSSAISSQHLRETPAKNRSPKPIWSII